MPKRLWVALDVGYPRHVKVRDLSAEAFRSHIEALCHAREMSDSGAVPRSLVGHQLEELVDAGLVEDRGDARMVYLHDWDEWQLNMPGVRGGVQRSNTAARDEQGKFARQGDVRSSDDDALVQRPVKSSSVPSGSVVVEVQEQEGSGASFDTFWSVYPRREGKGRARTAFVKASRKVEPTRIITAAAAYRDDPNREPEYTAHPSTWLNQERWDDDPLPQRGGSKNASVLRRLDDIRRGNT